MTDSEFLKLEKAEQEVLAQIANQKQTCDNLRSEFRALRDDFLESYNETFHLLQKSLDLLGGDAWAAHREKLDRAVAKCSAAIKDTSTSEEIGALQTELKVRVKEALGETDFTAHQFQEMSANLRKLESIVKGKDTKDVLEEIQTKKQRLEKEEERLRSLQDRYDHYFRDRGRRGSDSG